MGEFFDINTNMKKYEKTALLRYLEFHLLKLCEHTEKNLDPDAVGVMYIDAYGILSDLDKSIDVDSEIRKKSSFR